VKNKKSKTQEDSSNEQNFDNLLNQMVEENKSVTSGIKKILKDIEKRSKNNKD